MAAVPGPGLWLGRRPEVPGCRPDPAVGRGGEPEMCVPRRETPGTTILDGPPACQGYALNKMFMSFNDAANRADFLRDEDAYCARYGLSERQCAAIGRAIDGGLQEDPYWKPFFDGFQPVHRWLEAARPDVAVVIYNDHGLNFFLDKMPTFAIGAAPEYRNADEGWGRAAIPPFTGHPGLSWHMIESIMCEEFDLTTCQEMVVDHAVVNPMRLLWPGSTDWPVRIVPIDINTVQYPLPSARRCWRFGEAIGRAINSYEEDLRVVVVGTGGLSHQL